MYRVFALLGLSLYLSAASVAHSATDDASRFGDIPMRPSLSPERAGDLAMTLPPAVDIAEAFAAGPALPAVTVGAPAASGVYQADGQVEAVREARLAVPVAGRVTARPVNAGDRVSAGQLVAEIAESGHSVAA